MTRACLSVELAYFYKKTVLPHSELSYMSMSLSLLSFQRSCRHSYIWFAATPVTDMCSTGMSAALPTPPHPTPDPQESASLHSVLCCLEYLCSFCPCYRLLLILGFLRFLSLTLSSHVHTHTHAPAPSPTLSISVVAVIRVNMSPQSGCSTAHWFISI